MPHVGQEMLTLSATPDFTPFGEFMICVYITNLLCIYIVYITKCVTSKEYAYGLITLVCLPGLVLFVSDLFYYI